MDTQTPQTSDRDYFILTVLFLIAVAFWASFFRYFINLNYDIYLTVECDPSVSACVTDEETYYERFLVKASTLERACHDNHTDACIWKLYESGQAEKLACDEDLEEWEYCSTPEEYLSQQEDTSAPVDTESISENE